MAGTTLSAQSLPASDDTARARLNASPRHGEWVKVESGGDTINAWVVYPERSDPAPVVLVIHEIYGLTDWIRSVADQLAAEGYIAIAPDILTGKGPGGGGTESVDRDGAVALVRALDRGEVVVRLNAVAQYATSLPAAQDKWASVGFCWGGSTSFAYAAAQPSLSAAVVYYGSSPSAEALGRIFQQIDQLEKTPVEITRFTQHNEAYRIPLLIGLAALALELMIGATVVVRVP